MGRLKFCVLIGQNVRIDFGLLDGRDLGASSELIAAFGRSTPLSRIDPSRSTLKFFSPVLDCYPHDLMAFKHRDRTVRKLVCVYFGRMLNASPRYVAQTRSARAGSR